MRSLIRRFDHWLSEKQGVFEFCSSPECILRLQLLRAPYALQLPGLSLQGGDPVLLLHLWNERLPPLPGEGADLGWARPTQRRFLRSLQLAAAHIHRSPQLAGARAIGGVTVLGTAPSGRRMLERLGFQWAPYRPRLGAFAEFWENFYTWLLIWTYNPLSLRGKRLWQLRRMGFWMALDDFQKRFLPAGASLPGYPSADLTSFARRRR